MFAVSETQIPGLANHGEVFYHSDEPTCPFFWVRIDLN